MKPETLHELAGLVTALVEFVRVLGSGWFALILISLAVLYFVRSFLAERARERRSTRIVDEKNKEIDRLAADNRRYREVYLERLGVPREVIDADRKDSELARKERGQK